MKKTIAKLLLTGVVSFGTIGTLAVEEKKIENKVEDKKITLEEAKEKVLSQVSGTIENTKEERDEYTIYTRSGNYIYEVEVDKLTGKVTEVDKELVKQEVKQKETSLDSAKSIALSKVNGTVVKTSEDDDDYSIYIKKDNYIYEIEVDKLTGKVEEIDKEKVKQPASQKNKNITLDKAKELALKKVNGKIVSSRSDEEDYEIIIQKDNYMYELDVDKKTGRIDDMDREVIKNRDNVISLEKAKEIALNKVNGTIQSVDYDQDDLEYSIEIMSNHVEYEVEIDGLSGKVLKVEKDD